MLKVGDYVRWNKVLTGIPPVYFSDTIWRVTNIDEIGYIVRLSSPPSSITVTSPQVKKLSRLEVLEAKLLGKI